MRRVREDRDPAAAPGRPTNRPLLLKGLLHCAQCGDEFQLETSGKTVNGTRSWPLDGVMCQNPTHLDPARSAVFWRRWGGQCSPTATVATVVP